MIRVLSIDFDYFIATDANTRDFKFPVRVADQFDIDTEWNTCYVRYPEVQVIEVIPEYDACNAFLYSLTPKQIITADNHDAIMRVLNSVPKNEELEITNIDFHHDYYILSNLENITCANWVTAIKNIRGDNCSIRWVKRSDSETSSLYGSFPYYMTDDLSEVLKDSYDYVFFCFSPEWTPPHLRNRYNLMIDNCMAET